MKFRLTYEGRLRPTNRDALPDRSDPLSVHKHEIRSAFHGQLKHLWATNRFLREAEVNSQVYPAPPRMPTYDKGATWADDREPIKLHDAVAGRYNSHGFRFLPLVTDDLAVLCSLDILFLRRDAPGSALHAGDIDNRIKTVIDALRPPKVPNEFVGVNQAPIVPLDGQDPFYCLLEDDKLVSHFSVETDTLLDPPSDQDPDTNRVRLVITVELRPYDVNMLNLNFG